MARPCRCLWPIGVPCETHVLTQDIAHRRWKEVWDGGGKTTGGLGDGCPPVGSRGRAPVWGLGDDVPQKLKNF